jgi:HEAT repeat protein
MGAIGGPKAAALLENSFESQSAAVRRSVIMATNPEDGAWILPLLQKGVDDSDVEVRSNAISKWMQVGDSKIPSEVLKRNLERALKDPDGSVRARASFVLGGVDAADAVALFDIALENQDYKMTQEIVIALGCKNPETQRYPLQGR